MRRSAFKKSGKMLMAKRGLWRTAVACWSIAILIGYASVAAAAITYPSSTANKVHLRISGETLRNAMVEVSRRSQVPILLSPNIVDLPVEVDLQGDDWHAVLRAWLRGFDHLAILDRTGRYRKIWITAKKTAVADEPQDRANVRDGKGQVDPGAEPDVPTEFPVAIWEPLDASVPSELVDTAIPSAPVQMDPALFDNLQVGQPIEIPIPQEEISVFGVVGETHDQLNGEVQVWSGPVDGSHETASFTITRGQITTYVTVATGTRIYEVSLDNATGVGSVVNEVDLTKGKNENDIVIPKGPSDISGADSL